MSGLRSVTSSPRDGPDGRAAASRTVKGSGGAAPAVDRSSPEANCRREDSRAGPRYRLRTCVVTERASSLASGSHVVVVATAVAVSTELLPAVTLVATVTVIVEPGASVAVVHRMVAGLPE